MKLSKKSSLKYKLLTKDELIINLDRLSRFKLPEYSFNRVFTEIIIKCLISPKYSKEDINELDSDYIVYLIETIWNDSVNKLYKSDNVKNYSFKALRLIIKHTFKNLNNRTKTFLKAKLNISPILQNLEYESAPFNLKFLIRTDSEFKNENDITIENMESLCRKYGFYYPIKKLIIVEGITEEILLPVFANRIHYDFNKYGIYVLGAGGKSKSPSLYLKLKEKLNIPVILLFDDDAKEICTTLSDILLKKDKYIIIENGEFEDILSKNTIKRTLNSEYEPATPIVAEDLRKYDRMCLNIENFYRTRHLGEFKKSKFAKLIAQNIKYETDITKEIKEILSKII